MSKIRKLMVLVVMAFMIVVALPSALAQPFTFGGLSGAGQDFTYHGLSGAGEDFTYHGTAGAGECFTYGVVC